MKNSVPGAVEGYIAKTPMLEEFLAKGWINQSALARDMVSWMEQETGEVPTTQSVIMAIKRFSESAEPQAYDRDIQRIISGCSINLRSGVADIAVEKTENIYPVLQEMSKKIDTKRGEVLSVLQGTSEMAVIIDERYVYDFLDMLKWGTPLKIEKDLVELHILVPSDFWDTPGIIYHITKQLTMSGINIIDILSITTEISVLVGKPDAANAFEVLNRMIENARNGQQ